MPFAGHRPVGRVEVLVFTKGRFHQRAEGLDEHMRQVQQSAEIRPCIELEKVGETTGRVRKGVSRVTLTSDSPSAHPAREEAGVKAAWLWVSGKVSSMQILVFSLAKKSGVSYCGVQGGNAE